MPRRDVVLCPGEHYHIYNRGNNREPIFHEHNNYVFFLLRLRKHLLPVMDIVAYCLMPTHYHLLAQIKGTPDSSNVSRAMMRFSVSYTKAMNQRYARVGSLFQGAFQAKHIERDDYLTHLSRYIHLNPVADGLVRLPEDWEFSSYREYIGKRSGTLPKPHIVLSQFPSPEAYREFTESYTSRDLDAVLSLLSD